MSDAPKKRYFRGGKQLIDKYAAEMQFSTEREFARFLHSVEPARTVNGWRNAILRWKKKGGVMNYTTHAPIWNRTEEPSRVGTHYDKTNDVYLSYLPSQESLVNVGGDTHRAMRHSYSADGENLSVDEMARKYSKSATFIREYIAAFGWSHTMDAFTDEEILGKSVDELVETSLASRRRQVREKANKKMWNDLQKDADRMRMLDDTLLNEFREAISKQNLASKKVNKRKMKNAEPYAVVISPTDLHFGAGSWIDETGSHYDTVEAKNRLIDRTNNLITRLPSRPEKIILATGSDWFHIDNEEGSTTKGTIQDLSTSPAQIFMDGCELARQHIDLLREVTDVQVVFMRGNHDRQMALALMMYLKAVYDEVKDVDIVVDPKLRQYITWGNNLLGFTHGDGVRGNDLPLLMASEQRKEWGTCEHHTWFHGHLHHQRLLEKGGTTVIQLPSLAGADRWHYRKGHVLARAGICAHLLDKELGLIGNLFAPVLSE